MPPGSQSGLGDVCPLGHYCPLGSTVPTPCPAGTFANETGLEICHPCPAGFYCLAGSTTFLDTPCPGGRYCLEGTEHADQYLCPARTFFNETGAKEVGDCLPCTQGMYCETDGLVMPTGLCAQGEYIIYIYIYIIYNIGCMR